MDVELIAVGTEILLGNIVNTNAAYLAEKCALLGLSLYYQSAVGDNEDRLENALQTALERSSVIILCGGLGPTKDDLTKEVAAKVMEMPLVTDTHTRERIASYFVNSHYKVITENNWKQAQVPKGATVLDNDNGTAPGLILKKNDKVVILLPGPPNELIPMFETAVAPYLREMTPEIICSTMVKICGKGESLVATEIGDMIETQTNPTIAPYAKMGEVHLRVTAKAANSQAANQLMAPIVEELKTRFGTYVYSTLEEETLEASIINLLRVKGLTLTTAESCTGGMLSARLTNVSGGSDVFKQGVVTYCNHSKEKMLGLQETLLLEHGAVSAETAEAMAKCGTLVMESDICVSITGIAGPTGGSKEKPIGLVYIACCYQNHCTVKRFNFKGNRSKVRENAVVNALILLRNCILNS